MDELAAELGGIRWSCASRTGSPTRSSRSPRSAGLTYDSGNYEAATDRAMELFGYDGLRAEQAKRRAGNDPVQLGIGISTFTEMCGLAPSRVLGALKYVAGGWEAARSACCRPARSRSSPAPRRTARVTRRRGARSRGLPRRPVRGHRGRARRHRTRARMAWTPTARGRWRSVAWRSCAPPRRSSTRRRQDRGAPDGGQPRRPRVRRRCVPGQGRPGASTTIQAIAFEAFSAHNLPDGMEPTPVGESTVDPADFSFPHGTHLCAVEVDTETGHDGCAPTSRVDDIGKVDQPDDRRGPGARRHRPGHRAGAVRGGACTTRTASSSPASIADYLIPTAADLPTFATDRTETPSTTHPLGVKGVGEAGHDRVHPGGHERRRRRAAAARSDRHADAGVAAERVAGYALPRAGTGRAATEVPDDPRGFDYVRPTPSPRRVAALAEAGEDAKVLAGGQSLLPLLRLGWPPRACWSTAAGSTSCAGSARTATPRHRRDDDAPRRDARPARRPARAADGGATRTVADPAIRHRGTFGGSLAHADPAGDLPAVALALDAEFVVAGPGGRRDGRRPPTSSWTTSRPRSSPDEVLVEVRVPKLGAGWGCTTRSSSGPRRHGRSSASRRPCAGERLDRRGSRGLTNMGRCRSGRGGGSCAGRATAAAGAVAAACASAAEGTARRQDLAAARTTGRTSPGC